MKLLQLRPPRERLRHSTSPVRRRSKPGPQPALSVTVESPARTMRIFAVRVVAGAAARQSKSRKPAVINGPMNSLRGHLRDFASSRSPLRSWENKRRPRRREDAKEAAKKLRKLEFNTGLSSVR